MGQRLIDIMPYHSEWRMKNPDNCLLFCALSSVSNFIYSVQIGNFFNLTVHMIFHNYKHKHNLKNFSASFFFSEEE